MPSKVLSSVIKMCFQKWALFDCICIQLEWHKLLERGTKDTMSNDLSLGYHALRICIKYVSSLCHMLLEPKCQFISVGGLFFDIAVSPLCGGSVDLVTRHDFIISLPWFLLSLFWNLFVCQWYMITTGGIFWFWVTPRVFNSGCHLWLKRIDIISFDHKTTYLLVT